MPPSIAIFFTLCLREINNMSKTGGFLPLAFLIIVNVIFPLSGADNIKIYAHSIIWLAMLLAVLLSFDSLFNDDFADGFLEHVILAPAPATLIIISKMIANWIIICLPLVIISIFSAFFIFALKNQNLYGLIINLICGSPLLSLIGTFAASLAVGAKRSPDIIALIALPLYIPVLILGSHKGFYPQIPIVLLLLFASLALPFILSSAKALETLYE